MADLQPSIVLEQQQSGSSSETAKQRREPASPTHAQKQTASTDTVTTTGTATSPLTTTTATTLGTTLTATVADHSRDTTLFPGSDSNPTNHDSTFWKQEDKWDFVTQPREGSDRETLGKETDSAKTGSLDGEASQNLSASSGSLNKVSVQDRLREEQLKQDDVDKNSTGSNDHQQADFSECGQIGDVKSARRKLIQETQQTEEPAVSEYECEESFHGTRKGFSGHIKLRQQNVYDENEVEEQCVEEVDNTEAHQRRIAKSDLKADSLIDARDDLVTANGEKSDFETRIKISIDGDGDKSDTDYEEHGESIAFNLSLSLQDEDDSSDVAYHLVQADTAQPSQQSTSEKMDQQPNGTHQPHEDAGQRKASSASERANAGRKTSSTQNGSSTQGVGSRPGSIHSGGRPEGVRPGSVQSNGRPDGVRTGSVHSGSRSDRMRSGSAHSGSLGLDRVRSGTQESDSATKAARPASRLSGTSSERERQERAGSEFPSNVVRPESRTSEGIRAAAAGYPENPKSGARADTHDPSHHSHETKPEPQDLVSEADPAKEQESASPSHGNNQGIQQNSQHPEAVGHGSGTQRNSTSRQNHLNGDTDSERKQLMEQSFVDNKEYGSPTRPKPPGTPFSKPSSQRMAELDRHVLTAPAQLHQYPPFRLVQYLLRVTQTEVEIAYVLFRWVTCQDVKEGQTTEEGEPEAKEDDNGKSQGEEEGTEAFFPTLSAYVEQLKNGKIDHADMFSLLCKCANLETHKVIGKRRFYCSQPSPQLCRTRPADWSAVLLHGGWGFVDCALGARHWAAEIRSATTREQHQDAQTENSSNAVSRTAKVNGNSRTASSSSAKKGNNESLSRFLNSSARYGSADSQEHCARNFYFLPPPDLLVTSHFPDNPRWQLLPHPVAETDFLTSLLKKPHLHYLDVELVSPTALKVTDIKEETDLMWKLKGKGLRRFAFRLFCVSDNRLSGEDLTRYGFLENQHSKGDVTLRLIPPSTGRYVCELYGTYVPTRGSEMVHLCSFDLDFVKTITTPLQFPHNDRVEWGPGAECLALGLVPLSHISSCINVDKGEAQIAFSSSRAVLVTQKLFMADSRGPGTEVPRSTINFRDSKNKVKILLRIPEGGDYVLSIYAKEESSPGKCQLVCNYLVLCDSGTPEVVHPFPSLPYNKLGPTKAFIDFNMKLVCPKKSCIVVAPYSGKVTFVFISQDDAELSCDLQHLGIDEGEVNDAGDYVQHTCQSGESVFRARLPLSGDYLFHLYGKPSDGEGHKFLLYSALIECAVPNKDCLPLPRVVPDWRSRVQILAPLRRGLVQGAVTHFAVRAYKVKAMAIIGQSGTQKFVSEDEEEENETKDNDKTKDGKEKDNEDEKVKDSHKNADTNQIAQNGGTEEKQGADLQSETTQNGRKESQVSSSTEQRAAMTGKKDTIVKSPEKTNEKSSHKSSVPEHSKQAGSDQKDSAADKKRSIKKDKTEAEDEKEEEEGEDGWQVWRCKVKVNREDEGSGVKLCVLTSLAQDSRMICVAEFEVITERNMTARLDHQHAIWAAAEENFKVRPDSGHRSDLDDEERQSAYFLDDEVYLSNPLGDENSDDDLSGQEDEDDDENDEDEGSSDADDEFTSESNFEDTTSGSAPGSVGKQDRNKVDSVDKNTKSSRKQPPKKDSTSSQRKPDKGPTFTKKSSNSSPRKAPVKLDKKREFHPTQVYSTPQVRVVRGNQKVSTATQDKTKNNASLRRGEAKDRPVPKPVKDRGVKKEEERRKEDNSDGRRQEYEKVAEGIETLVQRNEKKKKTDALEDADKDLAGTKERRLRRMMWNACQRRDREAIQKSVTRYTRGGYPPCADLAAAERLLTLYELRDALVAALDSKDMDAIRQALTEVERHGYAGEMSVVCRKAHALLSPHRVQNRLPAIVETDMRTLLEIRSYRCPPEVVHHVVVASLLLVGVHEGLTKTWKKSRRRMQVLGPQGILKKMVKIKVDAIHPEISARARVLLDKHTVAEANSAGPGVVAIYKWARGVVTRVDELAEMEEAYNDFDNDNEPPQPASKRRQREIFKQQSTQPTTTTTSPRTQDGNSTLGNTQKNNPSKQHTESGGPNTPRGKTVSRTKRDQSQSRDRQDREGEANKSPRRTENQVSRKDTNVQWAKDAPRKSEQKENTFSKETKRNSLAKSSGGVTSSSSSTHTTNTNPSPGQTKKPSDAQERQRGIKLEVDRTPFKPFTSQDTRKRTTEEQNSKPTTERQTTRTQLAHGSNQGTGKTGNDPPKGTARPGATSFSGKKTDTEEGLRRPQQTPRMIPRRFGDPQEPLRTLTPHKSPLFRPPSHSKNKADMVKYRSLVAQRPKTTPAPVLQSTFFFASLVKNDADSEENNNIPLTFKNHSNGSGKTKATKSASLHERLGSRAESRGGDNVDYSRRPSRNGRRSVLEITTPDI